MKHNVRTINGKRIVGGDPNLATKNEIHVSKIPEELGIQSGGNERIEGFKYYLSKQKLPVVTYMHDTIETMVRHYLWKFSYYVRGNSTSIGNAVISPTTFIIDFQLDDGYMDGIFINLNCSGIMNMPALSINIEYSNISDLIYKILLVLLGEELSQENLQELYKQVDTCIKSTLVEVSKEDFFNLNHTLIEEE